MYQTFAKMVKIFSAILIVLLLSLSLFFSGCGCVDKNPPTPPQNNEESTLPEENGGNSNNSSNNGQEITPSSPEIDDNSQNNQENTNPPTDNENQDSSNDNGKNEDGNENNQDNTTEGNGSSDQNNPAEGVPPQSPPQTPPETPPSENEDENEVPEQPSTPVNNYSLKIKTFENNFGYTFANDCFFVDFSSTNALYFEIKLLNNEEIVENVHFNICLNDNSFGIFDSVIYNSVYIEIQKVGEFEITISSTQHNFSKTFKVVVI